MDYHDALAALGAGSAHPGGFSITREWMAQIALTTDDKVLEIGCGTGRTSCEIAQRFGCVVLGVDRNVNMIHKARKRAMELQAPVQFSVVSGDTFPFPDGEFDAIIAESVSVFNEPLTVLHEYYRLLKATGMAIDVEMCANSPLPPDVFYAFQEMYGAKCVPTMTQWKQYYRAAGFSSIRILRSGPVPSSPVFDSDVDSLAPILTDADAYSEDVYRIMNDNQLVMHNYAKWLNFAVIVAQK
ncbi:class I SAM-dependent methyltransferase [Sulfoacidibacillus ferrooxidans]|uniref:Ubiquinone/menaquinone biosynthesis C-methyltransferase UbiE n=1 Tax=Sulfoacidibacillus ferrooxidans TaxID=2005001 RepID=A0A9X1VBN4_9BACL|nr:class I SAM-dependent methyltransferase [Sulfoacidibacillus ferrooxidans]MCI0184325.1 Ubiquinone/menaquinone biosynthesis C-methyltransferase UbiE [Sulfoacidibacillus ferrooxidans]